MIDGINKYLFIYFCQDVLFPYVRENLKSYVDSHWNDEEFAEDLKALKQQVFTFEFLTISN